MTFDKPTAGVDGLRHIGDQGLLFHNLGILFGERQFFGFNADACMMPKA